MNKNSPLAPGNDDTLKSLIIKCKSLEQERPATRAPTAEEFSAWKDIVCYLTKNRSNEVAIDVEWMKSVYEYLFRFLRYRTYQLKETSPVCMLCFRQIETPYILAKSHYIPEALLYDNGDGFVSSRSDQVISKKHVTLPLFCTINNSTTGLGTCETLLAKYGESYIGGIKKIMETISKRTNSERITWNYKSDLHYLITSLAFRILLTDCDNAPSPSWHEYSGFTDDDKHAFWRLFYRLRSRLLAVTPKVEYSIHMFVCSKTIEDRQQPDSMARTVLQKAFPCRNGSTVTCLYYISLLGFHFVICDRLYSKEEFRELSELSDTEQIHELSESSETERIHEIIDPFTGGTIIFTEKELFTLPKIVKNMKDTVEKMLVDRFASLNITKIKELRPSVHSKTTSLELFDGDLVVRLPPEGLMKFIDAVPHLLAGNQSITIGKFIHSDALQLVWNGYTFETSPKHQLYLDHFLFVYSWLLYHDRASYWCLVVNCVNEQSQRYVIAGQFRWSTTADNEKASLHNLYKKILQMRKQSNADHGQLLEKVETLAKELELQPMPQSDWEGFLILDEDSGNLTSWTGGIMLHMLFRLLKTYVQTESTSDSL